MKWRDLIAYIAIGLTLTACIAEPSQVHCPYFGRYCHKEYINA